MREIEEILREVNPGDDYKTSNEVKIEILKKVLPALNLRIGQVINRHNSAGDSWNKVIGFILNWQYDRGHYFVDDCNLHIICDRVKRYNKSYSSFYNKPEFFHGEIWAYCELKTWRERGDIVEDTAEAEQDFINAKASCVKHHDYCFVDQMLSW